jgi:hypothetical protein
MKVWSVHGLLFIAAIFWSVPVSAQVTQPDIEVSVDRAKPANYARSRRATRRAHRGSSYAAAARYWPPAYVSGGTHYGYVGAPYGYWPVGHVYETRSYIARRKAPTK